MAVNGKDFFASKTNIGTLVAFVAFVLNQLGIEINDTGFITDRVFEIVTNVMAGGGALLALYGRYVAKAPITSVAGAGK